MKSNTEAISVSDLIPPVPDVKAATTAEPRKKLLAAQIMGHLGGVAAGRTRKALLGPTRMSEIGKIASRAAAEKRRRIREAKAEAQAQAALQTGSVA